MAGVGFKGAERVVCAQADERGVGATGEAAVVDVSCPSLVIGEGGVGDGVFEDDDVVVG